jgi:hypothetical protein
MEETCTFDGMLATITVSRGILLHSASEGPRHMSGYVMENFTTLYGGICRYKNAKKFKVFWYKT